MTTAKKRANFKKIAEKRVNILLEEIERLKNLTNKSYYSSTDKEREQVITTLQEAIMSLEEHFKEDKQERRSFKL